MRFGCQQMHAVHASCMEVQASMLTSRVAIMVVKYMVYSKAYLVGCWLENGTPSPIALILYMKDQYLKCLQ